MKKKQLSKLALMGLATGVAMAAAVDVSANTMTEKNGTYLAGGCGGSGCGGAKNRSNPTNYTADTYTTPSNAPVNPNMAPKPEAMQNRNLNTANGQSCSANRPANGQYQQQQNQVRQGSCQSVKPAPYPTQVQGQPQAKASCGGARPNQGQPASHGCGGGQTAGCGAQTNNGYRR